MIRFENISLSYGDKEILKDFSLEIREGDKILLDAPSGRGKSSLIKLLLGFVKPQRGSVYYRGSKVDKKHIDTVRKNTAWVNQDINLRKIVVRDLIAEINSFEVNRDIHILEGIRSYFEDFSLGDEILDKNIETLSGGERQRLGLVIAIVLDREILLLDEVTSSLDITLKKKVEEYILSTDKTVLLISHDTHWTKDNFRVVRW